MSRLDEIKACQHLAWDKLTTQQWTTLVTAALAKGDLKAIPGILALCAVHGHPEHAEFLRQMMLTAGALR